MKHKIIEIDIFNYAFDFFLIENEKDGIEFLKKYDEFDEDDFANSGGRADFLEEVMYIKKNNKMLTFITLVHETHHLSKYILQDRNIGDENGEVDAYLQCYMLKKILKFLEEK